LGHDKRGVKVLRSPAVSRPAWINLIAGSGPDRKSPVEIFATATSVFTRSQYAGVAGLRGGRLERWTDGVGSIRADCRTFARYWRDNNEAVLADPDGGPVWVVLGDSTAQGIGAPGPDGGYVGQSLRQLEARTGERWRILNLSVSGSLIRDVLAEQVTALEALPIKPALVTCGIGANDILFSSPSKLFSDLRTLLATVPEGTVMLDLPVPRGFWWIVGMCSVPYITRINRVIAEVADSRGLLVAQVSAQFLPPWPGKFSVDSFHPSQDGYRDWARALLAVLPAGALGVPCPQPSVVPAT
jgi:lysophospholipase L1-like esterase